MEPTTNTNKEEDDDQRVTKTDYPIRHSRDDKIRHHSKSKILSIFLLAIVSISFGFIGGKLGSSDSKNSANLQSQKVILSSEGQIISGIAKNVGPSVVSIDTTGGLVSAGIPAQQQSAGTGIILTKDGLIITNRHVVPVGTSSVSVTLSDGTTFNNVSLIGRTSPSSSLDIAFLQITNTNGKTLTPAIIGDSSKTQIGDPVVAIGNALGQFQNTVTSGIVSGHGRSIQATDSNGNQGENLADLFQTDAAINEGNSGGPLVNLDGDVIGINTAIAGNAQNIGFAIPINDISGMIEKVEKTGKFVQPYIGVIYIPITSDIAAQYNLTVNNGAYIPPSSLIGQSSIIPQGPAEKAGLKEGDIITKLNNQTIDSNSGLTSLLDKQSVGDNVNLTVIRDGKTISVNVILAAAPSN
jgi:S1-C subfamily serine protease